MIKNRIVEMDFLRGIAILLVVFGHALPPIVTSKSSIYQILWNLIYNFHMPLFFIISGFFFYYGSKRICSYKEYFLVIFKKFQLLMVPYFTISVISFSIINLIILTSSKLGNILNQNGYHLTGINDFFYSVITQSNHIDQHLWFVYVLFIYFILGPIIEWLPKKKIVQFILTVSILTITLIGYYNTLDHEYGVITKVMMFSFYFYFGKILFIIYNLIGIKKISKYKIVYLILYLISSYILYITIDRNLLFTILFFKLTAALSGTFLFISIAYSLKNALIKNITLVLSKYSYEIYLLHQPFIVSGSVAILMNFTKAPLFLIVMISTILGIGLPIILTKYLINKNKILKILITGKN